jgi:hypothetical protein
MGLHLARGLRTLARPNGEFGQTNPCQRRRAGAVTAWRTRAGRCGAVLAVSTPATEAMRGLRNENWRRVANPPGKVGGGETHRGGVAPVERWVQVATAALKAVVELRWIVLADESPWSTKVTGKR